MRIPTLASRWRQLRRDRGNRQERRRCQRFAGGRELLPQWQRHRARDLAVEPRLECNHRPEALPPGCPRTPLHTLQAKIDLIRDSHQPHILVRNRGASWWRQPRCHKLVSYINPRIPGWSTRCRSAVRLPADNPAQAGIAELRLRAPPPCPGSGSRRALTGARPAQIYKLKENNRFASRSVPHALSMPRANSGPLYRCGEGTQERPVITADAKRGPEIQHLTTLAGRTWSEGAPMRLPQLLAANVSSGTHIAPDSGIELKSGPVPRAP